MTSNQKALCAIESLEHEYPEAKCSLTYSDPFQLLIATRLAAQCTDARVNLVTPDLFGKYPDIKSLADANISDVEEIIKSCGLYKTKARDIVLCAKALRDNFNCKVPDTIEQLVTLPGIGRKTANLIVGDIFGKSAVVVDTHCTRITKRLGFHNEQDPVKIEKILREILPADKSNDFCHRLVLHGRKVCRARNPLCAECCMNDFCDKNL